MENVGKCCAWSHNGAKLLCTALSVGLPAACWLLLPINGRGSPVELPRPSAVHVHATKNHLRSHSTPSIDVVTRRPRAAAARARSLKRSVPSPPCMEPVFTVQHGHEPPVVPPPHHGPGRQMEGQGRRGWARPVVALLVVLGVTVGFAFGVHRARHSARDLAFAIVTYYLFLVLVCCVVKLRLYPPATAVERRRVRICAWVLSVALGLAATARVADAVHGLALKLVVWGISIVLHGIGLYFFLRKGADDERSDAEELGRGLSPPEEKV